MAYTNENTTERQREVPAVTLESVWKTMKALEEQQKIADRRQAIWAYRWERTAQLSILGGAE